MIKYIINPKKTSSFDEISIMTAGLKKCNLIPKIFPSLIRIALLTTIQVGAQAAVLNVSESEDDGTGLVTGSLSKAILDANLSIGSDTIFLRTNVTLTGVMKRLIDSNVTLRSDTIRRTINGDNQYRPLFIKSGLVKIQDLDVINGLAKGGDTGGGGGGAGMGGALFIYGGKVEISGVNFSGSSAIGGARVGSGAGGGGMFGDATKAGGGLFGDAEGEMGGYGGFGRYQNGYQTFGKGGNYVYGNSRSGGFGGGGSSEYYYYSYAFGGSGGFGGGGGQGDSSGYKNDGAFGGSGGFGAAGGGGFIWYSSGSHGADGYGASNGNGAGMGGAVLIRSGDLIMKNTHFTANSANASGDAKGLGGGIFILQSTQNPSGNSGMPYSIPEVSACGLVFENNDANGDDDSVLNNNNYFATGDNLSGMNGASIEQQCPFVDLISDLGFEAELYKIARVESSPITGAPVCVENPPFDPRCAVPYDTSLNKAFQGNDNVKIAVANSTQPNHLGFIYFASHINDGLYGPNSSWLSDLPTGAVNNWIKIDLGQVQNIELVKFGYNRIASGIGGRDPGQVRIYVAQSDDFYANGDDNNDENEYFQVFDSLDLGFNGNINGDETIQANFAPTSAKFVKVVFENSRAIIDEIEVQ